jgi:hypothetical protein
MKKYAGILLTIVLVLGLGVAAKAQAQTRGEIVVKLPFAFVVSGKTLPAGTYQVSRFSDDKSTGLFFSSRENHTAVFVHPVEIESARVDDPSVSFEQVAGQHFLTRIQTPYDVYNIPVPQSAVLEVAAKTHDNGSASASSGSN